MFFSVGGSHRGCSKIPEVWEYSSPDVLLCVLWEVESTFHSFFLFCSFLFFIFAGTQLSLVHMLTNCKRKKVTRPAGMVRCIGVGKGVN